MVLSTPIRTLLAKIFRLIKVIGLLPRCTSTILNPLPFNILNVLFHICPISKELHLLLDFKISTRYYTSDTIYFPRTFRFNSYALAYYSLPTDS